MAWGSIYFLAHEIIGYWLIWELIAKVISRIRSDCVDWSSSLILFPHTQRDHTFSCHINKNKRPLMTFIDFQRGDSSLAPTTSYCGQPTACHWLRASVFSSVVLPCHEQGNGNVLESSALARMVWISLPAHPVALPSHHSNHGKTQAPWEEWNSQRSILKDYKEFGRVKIRNEWSQKCSMKLNANAERQAHDWNCRTGHNLELPFQWKLQGHKIWSHCRIFGGKYLFQLYNFGCSKC